MGLINKSYLVTLNQRVQGSSPCAPTKNANFSIIYLTRARHRNCLIWVSAQCPHSGPLWRSAGRGRTAPIGPVAKVTAANNRSRSLGSCGVQLGMSALCQ